MEGAAANVIENEAWIAGLRAGSEETVSALRARIRDGLGSAFADRPEVIDSDLEDFTQESIVRVMGRLDGFRGESGFATWAMAVAVRVSLTALRRRRWGDRSIEEVGFGLVSRGSSDASGARGELFHALRRAIDESLSPRQREVLLAELKGVPQVVLAERMSSTPGAIYKVSHDARKKLKRALSVAGFDGEAVRELLAGG
jgi:RNA polymerase sigma-70 factor (ECF subfamily)